MHCYHIQICTGTLLHIETSIIHLISAITETLCTFRWRSVLLVSDIGIKNLNLNIRSMDTRIYSQYHYAGHLYLTVVNTNCGGRLQHSAASAGLESNKHPWKLAAANYWHHAQNRKLSEIKNLLTKTLGRYIRYSVWNEVKHCPVEIINCVFSVVPLNCIYI